MFTVQVAAAFGMYSFVITYRIDTPFTILNHITLIRKSQIYITSYRLPTSSPLKAVPEVSFDLAGILAHINTEIVQH
ncbi:hypothetical protein AC579_9354 [Pseudocercospora musae]|uniref:Uncharacterized protein n=1 Tax=Pseudocercospora musae TaxID=113226 RepID=A0A139H0S3_9PEZI|nr:hypothetical protein AC579_9354 [Pseudocercospora musae]